MASNINYTAIDETFPIAGRDNDSQGFRDNYAVIKNNFEAAKSEIDDLQLNTARLDDANDFGGNNITKANFVNNTEEVYLGGFAQGSNQGATTTTLIEVKNGPLQIFTANPSTNTLQFTVRGFRDYQNGKLAKVRIQLFKGPAYTSDVSVNVEVESAISILSSKGFPDPIILSTNPSGSSLIPAGTIQKTELDHTINPIIFDLWSYDNGYTVYCQYIGQFSA